MVWDPRSGQLALVYAGESLGSGDSLLKTDGIDENQALWQFVVEVAFGVLRAWYDRVLLAPVELSRCFRHSDPQGRVQVKIIAQLAMRPTNTGIVVHSLVALPPNSGYKVVGRTPE